MSLYIVIICNVKIIDKPEHKLHDFLQFCDIHVLYLSLVHNPAPAQPGHRVGYLSLHAKIQVRNYHVF